MKLFLRTLHGAHFDQSRGQKWNENFEPQGENCAPGDKSTKILKQFFFVTKSAKGPVGALLMSFDQPISSSIMINHTVRQTYSMKDG